MSQPRQAMTYKVAGLLCMAAGLLFTIAGKVPIGMMDVAVGAMLMALAKRQVGNRGPRS